MDHVLKYDRVNILTEQVEEEPVADVTLPDYCVYAFFFHSPVSQAKHKCSDVRAEDDDYSVDDDQAGKETQEEKPEPDEDVDLFVDCNRVSLCLNTCGRETERILQKFVSKVKKTYLLRGS